MSEPAATGLTLGSRAPDFSVPDQYGAPTDLSALLDRPLLLVFFPFAFSGTCTDEIRGLSAQFGRYKRDGLAVAAMSCDPMFSLKAWSQELEVAFPLLSDFWPHGEVARAYGVFDEQVGMALRGTFLIGTDAVVRKVLINGPGQARDLAAFTAGWDSA